MKWLSLAALAACVASRPLAPPAAPESAAALELVESAPIETSLDHPDLRDAWEVWPQMIARAEARIDLAEFYASEQAPSRLTPVIDALFQALRRGVPVRFLADARFAQTYPEVLAKLAEHGATVRHYEGLHAKYFVVDGREAYLGSQNFDWRSLEHIQELGVRFRQSNAVRALEDIFEADWSGKPVRPSTAYEFPQPVGDGGGITLVVSPRGSFPDEKLWDLPALVELIDSAKISVRVQLLTYGDVPELRDALARAAGRGVAVQLLLSDWELRPKTLAVLRALDPRIAVRILTIPQASAGFIPFARVAHAKYCAVDGARGWVGTSNWEPDYFFGSRNVGLVFDGGEVPSRLDAFFRGNWSSPYAAPFDRARDYAPPRISLLREGRVRAGDALLEILPRDPAWPLATFATLR
jgi:phosphatidylserine/phosphatidylglycerophosphate/cardiolipin synthase-like enzyme